ncbi:MAG: TIGR03936 family radical SAM-associated protein [Spirochaetes bacterium]|nr:TIGR03936 family radical SAM-associated protein [Spirochaetota bacterium]MBU1081329.1 TIGR03936 family radical SAM-associated protein [Spirochaetota bacterium]
MNRIDPCSVFKNDLPKIQKPARYLGGESGIARNEGADFKVALCFPDVYEIGMANNAMRILYSGLNRREGVACERLFSPGLDFEALLRQRGVPLYGLETGSPVATFDVLAFTLGYELAATNLLAILDLSGIPLRASERAEDCPIVIAGGPAITNPAPYARILDAVWIGEAEDAFFELVSRMRAAKLEGARRPDLIALLAAEPCVWMPGKKAVRNVYEGFSSAEYAYAFPTPIVKPIQDHGVVEIMRGCPNGCRFCHAGYYYRPRRLRSVDRILEDVEAQVRVAGHREISLSSLSSGDYPGIADLVSLLSRKWSREGVSFQLPSLKVESFPLELIEDISGTRKSGLTFAVETPLEQWQMTLNKKVGLEKISSILLEAATRGYRVAKFYFMIGLPLPVAGVKEEDAIISFIRGISAAAPKIKLNVTVAAFVPKPHTPFQWSAQLSPEDAASRIFAIKDAFRSDPRVKVTYHAPYLSWLEGIVARGDERVGELLVAAFERGARFDAWDDLFNKDAWRSAIESSGIDFSASPRDPASELPWSGVSLRVSNAYLREELRRSEESVLTAICAEDCAARCGACSDDASISGDADIQARILELSSAYEAERDDPAATETIASSREAPTSGTRHRLLFRYGKVGASAFFAHHEVQSMLSACLDRSGVTLAYSQGFNPMPRLEISEPLSLGFESEEEYGVAILTSRPETGIDDIVARANAQLHESLRIREARLLECADGKRFPSLSSVHWGSRFKVELLDTGFDPRDFVRAFDARKAQAESIAAGTATAGDSSIELLLPFAGSRELGLPALFEAAFGASIRDARVAVKRLAQYAKGESGTTMNYFDRYDSL